MIHTRARSSTQNKATRKIPVCLLATWPSLKKIPVGMAFECFHQI